jgi:hypothetical protein
VWEPESRTRAKCSEKNNRNQEDARAPFTNYFNHVAETEIDFPAAQKI